MLQLLPLRRRRPSNPAGYLIIPWPGLAIGPVGTSTPLGSIALANNPQVPTAAYLKNLCPDTEGTSALLVRHQIAQFSGTLEEPPPDLDRAGNTDDGRVDQIKKN
jgi:hypothetical protein